MANDTFFCVMVLPDGQIAAHRMPRCACCGKVPVTIKGEDVDGRQVTFVRDDNAAVSRALPPDFMGTPTLPEKEKVEA